MKGKKTITRIIKIGNSYGIRIPKHILEQTGLFGEVELEVQNKQLIIHPKRGVQHAWTEAFRAIAIRGDDQLLDP